MVPYAWRYGISIAVTVVAAMLGAAVASSEALELTKQQVAIVGVILAGLAILAGVLPPLQKYPSPERKGLD